MTPDRLAQITEALDGITPRCVCRDDAETLLATAQELLAECRRLSANDVGPIEAAFGDDVRATLRKDAERAVDDAAPDLNNGWRALVDKVHGLMFSRYALQKANEGHAERVAKANRRAAEAERALCDARDERRELVALCLALEAHAFAEVNMAFMPATWDDDDMPAGWREKLEAIRKEA